MANFVLADADAVLVDYDDRTAQAGFVLNGSALALDFGRWNASGIELDRDNLLSLFTDTDVSTGINPALQFRLDAFPQVTAGSSETITLTLSLRRGAISATDTTWDRETSLTIQVNVKVNAAGNQIVLSAVPTSTTYKVTASLNPAYTFGEASIDKWNFVFSENDVLGVVNSENGQAILEIYPLSFIAKLDSLASIYISVIKQSADNMLDAEDYYIEIGGLPLSAESGQSISTLGITAPIDDRATANQAPQIQAIADRSISATSTLTLVATDPESESITYGVVSGGSAATVEANIQGNQLTLTPASGYTTTQPIAFTVKASDSLGAYTTQQFDVTVVAPASTTNTVAAYYWGETAKPISAVTLSGASPVKATLTADKAAISLSDVLTTLKYYLGKTQLTGYAVQAADYNDDGQTTLSDVLAILKAYLGKSNPPAWEFEAVADTNPVEYVGVLKGDVNGSWVQTE